MAMERLEPYARIAPSALRPSVEGKTILITGGNGGIGAASAQSFAEAHAKHIIIVGRNKSKLNETAQALEAYKKTTSIESHIVDIASQDDVKALFASLETSPDILLNNAGYASPPESFVDSDIGEWWTGFRINVLGTALVTQAYLRHRKARASSDAPTAAVINVNTMAAYNGRFPGFSAYGASKSAQARWTELVQSEVPESTARFISIHPGVVKTEIFLKSGLEGKLSFPYTDVKLAADFIVWSTGEEAAFLNGRFLHVNWDVDELVAAKAEILEKDLLRTDISGIEKFTANYLKMDH